MSEKTDDEFEFVPRTSDTPSCADFCLTVTDDCMEPYIRKGTEVYVESGTAPDEFEAGVFYIKGCVLVRQWCEDYSGAMDLLAANPARQDKNLRFEKDALPLPICLGRVMLNEKLPRPVYL